MYIFFYDKVLYIKDRPLLLESDSVYITFAKNNVRNIDWNYLILTINKRLFTMKVGNHDTTLKLGSQHKNHF